jgi:hypothetical protein
MSITSNSGHLNTCRDYWSLLLSLTINMNKRVLNIQIFWDVVLYHWVIHNSWKAHRVAGEDFGVQASWKSESSPPNICMDWIIRGAIVIELYPSNMIRENSLILNWSWMRLTQTIRKWRGSPHDGKFLMAIFTAPTSMFLFSPWHFHCRIGTLVLFLTPPELHRKPSAVVMDR